MNVIREIWIWYFSCANAVHIHCTQDLKADTDIDLENIVYYKDDTHYFVMTAKKDSLLRKGVLREVSTLIM